MSAREILLRAKPDKSKFEKDSAPVWLYGDLSRFKTTTFVGHFHADLSTVGQFTGRLDKNGTKIFEGDVVRIGIPGDCFVTEWWDYGASFILRQKGGAPDITFDEYDEEAYEVAGNVHDNPELPEAAR